jgi:PTH1 family peptidyl-tRNA hydrolase
LSCWRLRIGIGHPGDRHKVSDYVLRRPEYTDESLIQEGIQRSLDVSPNIMADSMSEAMLVLHTSNPKL